MLREVAESTTRSAPGITWAQHLANHCEQIKRKHGKALLALQLRETSNGNEIFKRFVYREPDVNNLGFGPSRQKHRRIQAKFLRRAKRPKGPTFGFGGRAPCKARGFLGGDRAFFRGQ